MRICTNIEFSVQKPKKMLNTHCMQICKKVQITHLPQAKILLWWIKPFMPKVGFWAIERKTQQNYGTTDD